jgi:maltose-binding protein MalE
MVPMGLILVACSTTTITPFEEELSTEEPITTAAPSEESVIEFEPERELVSTVSIWHSFNENEIESLHDVIAAFQEIHPNVQFDILYVPPYDIHRKFFEEASTGEGPTILFGSPDWGPTLYDANLISGLSEFTRDEFLASINPVALGGVKYKDGLIGLPLDITGVVLFRNSNIIPKALVTFDNLVESAQAATSGDVIGAYLDYGLFFSAGHLNAVGGQLLDAEGNPTFDDEKGVEWLEMIERFKEAGPVESNEDNDINLFTEGKVGMIIEGLWNANLLAEAIGVENLAIDPWPQTMSGYVQTDNIYLNANANNNDAEAGWTFMEFMLSPDAQLIFSDPDKAGRIPVIKGIEVTDPIQKQALLALSGGTAIPIIPEMSVYWEPMDDALLSVMELGTDPAEALQVAYVVVVTEVTEIREE